MIKVLFLFLIIFCLKLLLAMSLDTCLPEGIFCYTDNLNKIFPKCCGSCIEDIERLYFNGICRSD